MTEFTPSKELMIWLAKQLSKAESAVLSREQGEACFRGGSEKSWAAVAKMSGFKPMTKAERTDSANREGRIAILCRHDVEMLKAIIFALSHPVTIQPLPQ